MNSMSDPISIGEREVHVWFAPVPPDPGAERELGHAQPQKSKPGLAR